jgi:uncharacterized protein YjbI with pentapeptide repeats
MLERIHQLWKEDPEFSKVILDTLKSGIAALATVMAAIWVFGKWLTELRIQRNEKKALEESQLAQQKLEETHRRQELAATLIKEFCTARDNESRLAVALALVNYREEAMPLLVNSLAYINDELVSGIEIVMTSFGVAALGPLANMNRIALKALTAEEPAPNELPKAINREKLLKRTKLLIQAVIKLAASENPIEFDTTEIDLSGANFRGLRLREIYFRKSNLDSADFKEANLRGARFRGTSLKGTRFLEAKLQKADFTAAEGEGIFIRADAEESIFDHSHFAGSNFEGARIASASISNSDFSKCDFAGAKLEGASIKETKFKQTKWRKGVLNKVEASVANFSRAEFEETQAKDLRAQKSEFVHMSAKASDFENSVFTDCDFGGSSVASSNLRKAQFINCNLGGVTFEKCTLDGVVFKDCELSSAMILNSRLPGVRFEGNNRWHDDKTKFDGSSWQEAIFDESNTRLKTWLEKTARAALPR